LAAKQRWLLWLGALSVAGLLSWVAQRQWSATAAPREPSREQPRPSARKAERALPQVSTLYQQESSAYHAGLFADEDGVVLVTTAGFTTLRPGRAPEERAMDLGSLAVHDGGSLIFWRSGKLQQIALSGGEARELVALPRPPQYLLASEGRIAWIQTEGRTGSSVQTLADGHGVRVVYDSEDSVSASVMSGASIYWVLRRRDGSWTIGRVGLDGQRISTQAHHGRPPAMLALGRDGLYFYDGPERGVRRLTFDLEREDAVLAGAICSPLVASSRVVCAHVGGLFEIPPSATAPRFLAAEPAGTITAMAVTNDHAFWVAENGGGHLLVRSAPLSGP
jgi:hypothetical protein